MKIKTKMRRNKKARTRHLAREESRKAKRVEAVLKAIFYEPRPVVHETRLFTWTDPKGVYGR